jgi:mannose-6-phosphate isomerase-like protein (cupin superfamily)
MTADRALASALLIGQYERVTPTEERQGRSEMNGDAQRFVIRASEASDLATDHGSFHLVQRDQLDLGDISVGVSDNPPGSGDPGFLHRHSCGEVFVVYEGRGLYTVGETEIVAEPGDMVIIPPNTWQTFRPDGDNHLRHVAVYDTGEVDIELSTGGGVFQL